MPNNPLIHSQAFAKCNQSLIKSDSNKAPEYLGVVASETRGLKSASGGLSHGFFVHWPTLLTVIFG